jgi:UDP-3-O-[3-hydroxymyristoyl] glucosamine N-acyltransferase
VREEFSLGELAVRFGLELRGAPELKISHVATLSQANAGALSFLANSHYKRSLRETRASAVLVAPAEADGCPVAALVTANPYLMYARIASLFHPPAPAAPGIHPSAVVSGGARIAASAAVGPLAVIEEGVVLGEGAEVGPGCIVQRGARVGDGTRLIARVNLYPGVQIGARCILHAGAVIGADGFGFASDGGTWVKVPQVGSVRIGDDVEIGANTTIDRGALGETRIGSGTKIDNLVHIGHNCVIGKNVVIAAQTGISGSSVVEDGAILGGQVGIGEHATVGHGVILGGGAGVLSGKKMRGPGEVFWGRPARPLKEYLRDLARLKHR